MGGLASPRGRDTLTGESPTHTTLSGTLVLCLPLTPTIRKVYRSHLAQTTHLQKTEAPERPAHGHGQPGQESRALSLAKKSVSHKA